MNFHRRKIAALSWICLGLGLGITGTLLMGAEKGGAKKSPEDTSLMRKKLTHAQSIIEGLALENYDMIQEQGKALKVISTLDAWMKFDTPAYKQLSSDFRAAVDKMNDAAAKKNLDGATLGFMQATMSCVECHKLIRSGGLVTGLVPEK